MEKSETPCRKFSETHDPADLRDVQADPHPAGIETRDWTLPGVEIIEPALSDNE